METITNAASAVVGTASNLIYGQPAKENETPTTATGGEPVSGEQGKGTATEPFDQGNKETSGNTSYKQDDFLKQDPAIGKPTKSFGDNVAGAKGESSLPIIPLNPDVATSSSTTTGDSDKAWKPTALDEVKPEGAPGAGPAAPSNVTPATGDVSSSTSDKKVDEPTTKDTTDSTPAEKKEESKAPAADEPPKQHSVGNNIDKILDSQPKSKHTVDDAEASDPHSKMTGKTVRQTDASQHGESANTKSLADDKTPSKQASHGSGQTGESGEGAEKTKLSTKEKLKQKLHIGHKDK